MTGIPPKNCTSFREADQKIILLHTFNWEMTDRRGIRTYTGLELILEKNTMSQWKSIIFAALFCLLLCTTELYALDSNKLNPEKQMENLSIDGIVKSLFGVVGKLHYAIYMRNGTDISQVALEEGRLLAKLSLEK